MNGDTSTRAERIGTVYNIGQVGSIGALPADSRKEIPEPELRLPEHAIVGRSELIAEVLAGMKAGVHDFAFEFLPGIGKTTVAAELIRDPELRGLFDGVLWAHLGQTPDERSELLKWAEAVGLDEATIAKRKTDGELSRAIAARICKRRLLLVVDDVWASEAGQYFMIGGAHCTRVITSRKRGVARELSASAKVHLVPKLSLDDSVALLSALAPLASKDERDELRTLADRVDGLPLALVLLGKVLRNNEDEPAPVRALLDSLRDTRRIFAERKPVEYAEDTSFSLAEVVEVGYGQLGSSGLLSGEVLDGALLREAVTALSVLRPDPLWFDEELALTVAGVAPATLRHLVQAGMLERRQSPQPGEARYTMHRVIAEYLRDKLSRERLQALNTRAADYYLARLKALEDDYQNHTRYRGLYRYESSAWRESQDNWLYHFSQAGYGSSATMAFLRVWFTAFWWWSCFTDEGFDFCDQLLGEWDHRLALSAPEAGTAAPLQAQSGARIAQLREGLDLLRRFKRAYPKETEDRNSASWSDVQAALAEVRLRARLEGEPPAPDNPDACVVRGLTDVFLAEAARFGRRDFDAAETLYRDGLQVFHAAGDDWDTAWTLYHLADMFTTCARHAQARPLCEEALRLARSEGDPELQALLHRVLGDIEVAASALGTAQQHYAEAVRTAYRFQVEPEAPDAYTIDFYPGVAQEVAARLIALNGGQAAAARAMAQGLRAPWVQAGALPAEAAPVDPGAAASPRALAALLFPPALDKEQLATMGEAYGERVKEHLSRW